MAALTRRFVLESAMRSDGPPASLREALRAGVLREARIPPRGRGVGGAEGAEKSLCTSTYEQSVKRA
jgi:hypothetical protein